MTGNSFSVMNVREDEVKIEGKSWEDDGVKLLAAKKVLQFAKTAEYWGRLLRRGRKLENYYNGKIFTDFQRAGYEDAGDIVMEPAVMKAPIRALVGQVLKSRKSGQVTTERNTAADAEGSEEEIATLNVVMKNMENRTEEEYRIKEAISSAYVSCYWNVLMFERCSPSRDGDGVRFKMTHLPWNSCVFGPQTIREPDGSDIKEMFYSDLRTMADLIDNYPEMEKQIADHFRIEEYSDARMLSSISQWEGMSGEERDTMYDIVAGAESGKRAPGGLAQTVMHLFPIKRKDLVWVNIFDETGETFEMRPPEWDDERWAKWVQENSAVYAGPVERETVTLWMTVFTTSGLVLYNGPHWYQENGSLPCSFWLGSVEANDPSGPAVEMADDALAIAVGETEHLKDNRNGGGRYAAVKEGAIKNIENLKSEATSSFGVAIVDKGVPISEAIHEFVRRPNDNWGSWTDRRKAMMFENSRINETMMGQVAPRQSAVAKQFEIDQALTVNATYIDNFNRAWERHQNLKLKMIAYLYTEWELIEALDADTGEMMSVEVNAPAEYDMAGNVVSVINDLGSHRYKWIGSAKDDSPSAKARNNEDALTIINAAAGPLSGADPTGGLFAMFLQSSENPMLQKYGKALAEISRQSQQAAGAMEQQKMEIDRIAKISKAKSDLLRAQKHGVMMNFAGEDIQNYPALYQLYIQLQDIFSRKADEELNEAQQLAAPEQPEQMGMAV
jgi:hypothetical protein